MIISQNQRRKKVTSLYKLSILKLLSNHHLLKDIENISLYFHLIKPVLFKLSKQQLLNLELQDPNLIELTEDIWYELLMRKFPNCGLSDETSRSRYLYLEQEQDLKRNALINKLRLHTRQLEKEKNSNTIEIIDHVPQASSIVLPKLQFKSSLLQKINKECSNKEKKFNHDVRFNQLTNKKRASPQASPVGIVKRPKLNNLSKPIATTTKSSTTTTHASSIFIPRSRATVFKDTPVPMKKKPQQVHELDSRALLLQLKLPSSQKNLRKSSIFIAFAR